MLRTGQKSAEADGVKRGPGGEAEGRAKEHGVKYYESGHGMSSPEGLGSGVKGTMKSYESVRECRLSTSKLSVEGRKK